MRITDIKINMMLKEYHWPAHLVPMSDFTIVSYDKYEEDGDGEFDIGLHSTNCFNYATFLHYRTHLSFFFPYNHSENRVVMETEKGYEKEFSRDIMFKNFGTFTILDLGHSRINFNNGKSIIFDPEGYAGDTFIEQLLGVSDELELMLYIK